MMEKILLLIIINFTGVGYAGWTSGGTGELIDDAHNPWFFITDIQAKVVIPYCILMDEEHFSATKETVRALIKNAFNYWWDQFSAASIHSNGGLAKIYVGQENFVEQQQCNEDNVIKFQFGYLSPEQLKEFDNRKLDPKRFVALTIREDYDRKNLLGKGFVYVGADSGPLKINYPEMMEEPWQDASVLVLVLMHEIGHIFGLQHFGSDQSLMGAGLPEGIINRNRILKPYFVKTNIFAHQTRGLPFLCLERKKLARFLDISESEKCVTFAVSSKSIAVKTAPNANDETQFKIRGHIVLSEQARQTYTNVVRVWLPDEQQVFKNIDVATHRILRGPQIIKQQLKGLYRNIVTGIERLTFVNLSPEDIQVGGVLENEVILDLLLEY